MRLERKQLVWGVILLVILVASISFGKYISSQGPAAIAENEWLMRRNGLLMCVLTGIFFYWTRVNMRIGYGIFEIGFAIWVINYTLMNYPLTVLFNTAPGNAEFSAAVAIMGAIYIIVRGLDNVASALDVSPKAKAFWATIFDFEAMRRWRKSVGL